MDARKGLTVTAYELAIAAAGATSIIIRGAVFLSIMYALAWCAWNRSDLGPTRMGPTRWPPATVRNFNPGSASPTPEVPAGSRARAAIPGSLAAATSMTGQSRAGGRQRDTYLVVRHEAVAFSGHSCSRALLLHRATRETSVHASDGHGPSQAKGT